MESGVLLLCRGERGIEMPQKKYPWPIISRRLIVRFCSAGVMLLQYFRIIFRFCVELFDGS